MTAVRAVRMEGAAVLSEGSEDAILSVNDVAFGYGPDQLVLSNVSFTIRRGEIVAIVGPSGCGKSTLLSLIARLRAPDSGSVTRNLRGGRHPLTMVFQENTLLPWLTVRENVELFLKFRKHRRAHRARSGVDARTTELLALAGLSHVASAYPYQLSGGMRRRLTFLSAIAPDPEVLLMDEPFSSVDEPTRVGIHRDVFDIARRAEAGMSIVLVTHDLAEALALSDRVIMLSGDRPSSVAGSYEVPFGDDREVIRIREEPRFLEMYAMIWHDLAKQIEIGAAREGRDV